MTVTRARNTSSPFSSPRVSGRRITIGRILSCVGMQKRQNAWLPYRRVRPAFAESERLEGGEDALGALAAKTRQQDLHMQRGRQSHRHAPNLNTHAVFGNEMELLLAQRWKKRALGPRSVADVELLDGREHFLKFVNMAPQSIRIRTSASIAGSPASATPSFCRKTTWSLTNPSAISSGAAISTSCEYHDDLRVVN